MWRKQLIKTVVSSKKVLSDHNESLRSLLVPIFRRSRILTSNSRNIYSSNSFYTKQDTLEKTYLLGESVIYNSFTYRTHTCGELRPCHNGLKVTVCGWVQYSRLSKFLLLRDGYGIIQCVVDKSDLDLSQITLESIVKIVGVVTMRPKDMVNTNMDTGEVEVTIDTLEILNAAQKLPFNLRSYQKPKEQLRMQHRYIDLRFPESQSIFRKRSLMLHNMRRFLVEKYGFIEVETPTLFCRTPGGAREFVVPTHHSGLFYSLVQSPQQFKQMLMCGAIDRYFQVARCYRDETTRPDRQPEFTQLDIELSFTSLDGVLKLIEELICETYIKELQQPPFQRFTYRHAIETYGSDKPDLCYDLTIVNLSNVLKSESNKDIKAYSISYPSEIGKLTAKSKDEIRNLMKKYGVRIILNENIAKELGIEIYSKIQELNGVSNDTIISLGNDNNACLCLGDIRIMLAKLLESKNLLIKKPSEPIWITDFPLFSKGENGALDPCHHPFTAPHPEDIHLLKSDPLKVRSLAYDLVMNGNEIGGGSVRIHNADLQEDILNMLNIDPGSLSHFLNALRSGCPPHAGIALGIDRLTAVACKTESIRDVIAFPKSHDGRDLLSGAPNKISEDDKKYYNIAVIK